MSCVSLRSVGVGVIVPWRLESTVRDSSPVGAVGFFTSVFETCPDFLMVLTNLLWDLKNFLSYRFLTTFYIETIDFLHILYDILCDILYI